MATGACWSGAAASAAAQAPEDPLIDLAPIGVTLLDAGAAGDGEFGGISGLAYDESTGTFLAVSDARGQSRMYRLRATLGDDDASGEAALTVEVIERLDLDAGAVDAEGIAAAPEGGWLVSFESPATVIRLGEKFEPLGRSDDAEEIARRLVSNKTWEAIAVEERGETSSVVIFSESGGPVEVPGWRERSTVVWLDPATLEERRRGWYILSPPPVIGMVGVVEAAALPGGGLLTLERRAVVPSGYDAAVFLAAPETAQDGTTYFAKAPLGVLSEMGFEWLGNLEAMAVGPRIDDRRGGRLLLLAADDNFGAGLQRGTQFIALRLLDARGQIQGPDPGPDPGAGAAPDQ